MKIQIVPFGKLVSCFCVVVIAASLAGCGGGGTFTASGGSIAYQTIDGQPSTFTTTLTLNTPWAGLGASGNGGTGLLAGSGVYVYQGGSGYAEIGVKIN